MCYMSSANKSTRGPSNPLKHTKMLFLLALSMVVFMLVCSCLVIWKRQFSFTEQVTLPVHKPSRTVVSISSFSQRVFHIIESLDSVFAQSQAPDRVIISIPIKFRVQEDMSNMGFLPRFLDTVVYSTRYNESEQDILNFFSKYVDAPYVFNAHTHIQNTSYVYEIGALTVQFLQEDWGPASKLMGALLLETHPDTIIITLDDDVVYHKDTVKWLATHMQHGIALSFGCEFWNDYTERETAAIIAYRILDFVIPNPRVCPGWLYGFLGAAYSISSFGPDIWTFMHSLPAGCFYNDDIWLSAYVAMRGVRRVYSLAVPFQIHKRYEPLSVSAINNSEHMKLECARYLFSVDSSRLSMK
jgi:hypothetical protein